MPMEKYLWTTYNGNLFLESKSMLIEKYSWTSCDIAWSPPPHHLRIKCNLFLLCPQWSSTKSFHYTFNIFWDFSYYFSLFSLTTNQNSTKLYCSFQFSSHQKMNMMSWRNRILEFMAKDVVSRVIEKLSLLLIQEPATLVGVEEQLQFIERSWRVLGSMVTIASWRS